MITATAGEFTLRQFWAARPKQSFRTVAVERIKQGPVDVFFVGSSHIYTGVDPSCFPYSVVNLADSALNYQMAEVLCRKYWDQVSQAKLVVIELDAVPVYIDTIERYKGDYRKLNEWGLSAHELPISTYDMIRGTMIENFTNTRKNRIRIHKPNTQLMQEGVPGPGFSIRNGHIDTTCIKEFFSGIETNFQVLTIHNNLNCMERLVTDLVEVGVNVKVLRPPFHNSYWNNPKGIERNIISDRALERLLQIPGIMASDVIDLRYLFQNENKCFIDPHHVSALGSRRLSKRLAQIIDLDKNTNSKDATNYSPPPKIIEFQK